MRSRLQHVGMLKNREGRLFTGRATRGLVVLLLVCSLLSAQQNAQHLHALFPSDETTNNQRQEEEQPAIYSMARSDRSGALIQDMMMASAWAYNSRSLYKGACPRKATRAQKNADAAQALLQQLGLDSLLPVACPPSPPKKNRRWYARLLQPLFWEKPTPPAKPPRVLPPHTYRSQDTAIFTPEWLSHVQRHVTWNSKDNGVGHQVLKVVLHVRRGDVKPCRGHSRYLPNEHYRRVVREYVLNPLLENNNNSTIQKISIVVHSETESYEPWDTTSTAWLVDQDSLNQAKVPISIQLKLDAALNETWYDMITADVLLLSRSSFSLVPALLNGHGQVIYTPFWHQPLAHWTVVRDMEATTTKVEQLHQQCLQEEQQQLKAEQLQNQTSL